MKSAWRDEPVAVMDACALIAFLNDEPGAEVVDAILRDVPLVEMAATNLLEVAYDAVRVSGRMSAAREIIESVRQLPIFVRWDMDESLLEIAAGFKSGHRISLADAVALASAVSRSAPLVTSDHHEFDPLEQAALGRFLWIRQGEFAPIKA